MSGIKSTDLRIADVRTSDERPAFVPPAHTTGVVFEGGGFRGVYTEGVFDVWIEQGIWATHAVGVSAGATFGCNYKSCQVGRALRYNKRFCNDPRYAGFGSLLHTGNFFSKDFAFDTLPWELDVFDTGTYVANPMRFTVVATDIETGEPIYHDVNQGDRDDVEWMRASSAIPALSRPVELEGRKLLDGGTADSIPFRWMLDQGCERCVVVCTQPAGFRKEPNSLMPALRVLLRRYPRLVELLANRHVRYNAQLDELAELERAGKVFVIKPSESVAVPISLKDPSVLDKVYEVGRRDGEATFAALKRYLA
ncbi:patatin-like phospholipase family protein [Enorma phocaeensis]|uniref:patatin-like phospholipase family protein n=1 Tax=Enorma phocaeensis TaxID=1871019 RepID=UPI001FE4D619|nr:patatin family protein [Enorma phocaeensis]